MRVKDCWDSESCFLTTMTGQSRSYRLSPESGSFWQSAICRCIHCYGIPVHRALLPLPYNYQMYCSAQAPAIGGQYGLLWKGDRAAALALYIEVNLRCPNLREGLDIFRAVSQHARSAASACPCVQVFDLPRYGKRGYGPGLRRLALAPERKARLGQRNLRSC